MNKIRKIIFVSVILFILIWVTGCKKVNDNESSAIGNSEADSYEITDYEICDYTMLPEELLEVIDGKKHEAFRLIYSNNTYTYMAVGYGEKYANEYLVVPERVSMKDGQLELESSLVSKEYKDEYDKKGGEASKFPYVVIRIKNKTE